MLGVAARVPLDRAARLRAQRGTWSYAHIGMSWRHAPCPRPTLGVVPLPSPRSGLTAAAPPSPRRGAGRAPPRPCAAGIASRPASAVGSGSRVPFRSRLRRFVASSGLALPSKLQPPCYFDGGRGRSTGRNQRNPRALLLVAAAPRRRFAGSAPPGGMRPRLTRVASSGRVRAALRCAAGGAPPPLGSGRSAASRPPTHVRHTSSRRPRATDQAPAIRRRVAHAAALGRAGTACASPRTPSQARRRAV